MKTFQQAETVKILGHTYNYDDELTLQDELRVTVYAPDGTEVLASTIMTNAAIGEYFYNYTLDSDATLGIWTVKIVAIIGAISTIENDFFKVIAVI